MTLGRMMSKIETRFSVVYGRSGKTFSVYGLCAVCAVRLSANGPCVKLEEDAACTVGASADNRSQWQVTTTVQTVGSTSPHPTFIFAESR